MSLTQGAIRRMVQSGGSGNSGEQPVCQILTVRKIPNNSGTGSDRYRVILSDGEVYIQAMLSTQTAHLVDEGKVDRNCLVRVMHYTANQVSNRQILVILELEVVSGPLNDRIGDPQNVEKVDEAGAGTAGNAPTSEKAQTTNAAKPPVVKNEGGGFGAQSMGASNNPSRPAQRTTSAGIDMSKMPIFPIEALSPYQNKWTIKARVTTKSEIKQWHNQRGEGKLFSCNFLDESGEIKATGFNEQVDRLYPLLKEGHVYFVTKARVNIARKKFSNLSNEYEIAFERDTQISECADANDVPDIKFNFTALDSLDGVEPKQTCDVIGIVEQVGEMTEITSKASQKPISKRELTLVDQSEMSVRLTLWGRTAETYGTSAGQPGCGSDDKPVIGFKGVSVSDFGGRSLSMFSSSTMHVNPDIPEAHGLRGWYDAQGVRLGAQSFKTYNSAGLGGTGAADSGMSNKERKTVAQAKDEQLGMSEKPDYFNLKGMVIFVKQDNLFYPACPKEGCNKKVTMMDQSSWRCEKCDMNYEAPQYRYIMNANVQDYTGSIWLSGFNEVGEQMFGATASELAQLKDNGDEVAYNEILERAYGHTWLFNIRAKQDTFNDVPRVRYNIAKMTSVDFSKEGAQLAEQIKKMMN
ncbi:hypothetical protein L7F22_009581 [Adiantum nelumboides]|nr:hypothetical protein [Adiantum nelumboides]